MRKQPYAIVYAHDSVALPRAVASWLVETGLRVQRTSDAAELLAFALRSRPRLAIIDSCLFEAPAHALCRRLKRDSYTSIVPTVMLGVGGDDAIDAAFEAGADEVLHIDAPVPEVERRLNVLLRRSDRDVYVHPSTRLPGTIAIDEEIARRIADSEAFAVCYADLDHFKEYNDRYSFADGDRVICLLATMLHDVVKGMLGERGFVGHIGGDDFIFIVPATDVQATCSTIVELFDELIPYQYSEQDRRAGYFFGKDRRGSLHRVPLMTLSIGVVTNERRRFVSPAHVSLLATEMKGYAKTLPGSVFTIDRRTDPTPPQGSTPPRGAPHISVVDES
ncbi:MAG TPA: diguanylate cyclase [Gemmatimonadaceae bacterium]|nr:diguanylate cyclase [Gemmatimonadaceae bacterium]